MKNYISLHFDTRDILGGADAILGITGRKKDVAEVFASGNMHLTLEEHDERLVKVDAGASVLAARDAADAAWRKLFAVDSVEPARPRILVYVPEAHRTGDDDRRRRHGQLCS